MSVKEVVDQLDVGVDLAPLLSWKYGQLMPMILMLAYILTAVQAVAGKYMSYFSIENRKWYVRRRKEARLAMLTCSYRQES